MKKKTVKEVIAELMAQVDVAQKNKQFGVMDALLSKVNRIRKRAKKRNAGGEAPEGR